MRDFRFRYALRAHAGRSGRVDINVKGYRRAVRTDLLERDRRKLRILRGKVQVDTRAHGFAAVRLLD